MKHVVFDLTGELAMWRNPYESMGSFSSLGPAPSNIAGLIGAALGLASPRSQASAGADAEKLKKMERNGLPWPVSEELLRWEEENDFHVACRWTGDFPKRIPWNVNGHKEVKFTGETLRIQQQVIQSPSYEVAVRIANDKAADELAYSLKNPSFRLYLGATFCPAIVKTVSLQNEMTPRSNWACLREDIGFGEVTPFFRHIVNPEKTFERLRADGYWLYSTPEEGGESRKDPFVKGYIRLEGP